MQDTSLRAPLLLALLLEELARAEEEVGVAESESSAAEERAAAHLGKRDAIKNALEALGYRGLNVQP